MVILFLKQVWFVLSLNQHAHVLGQEPAQEMGTGGLLSWGLPAAQCRTTARGFAGSFKGVVFLCYPGWKQIL